MAHDFLLALVWYLTLTCFGIVVLPLSMMMFRRMPDGGILLARPLGWLLIAFFSWWASFILLPFNRFGILLTGLLLFGLSLFLLRRNPAWFERRWRIHWRTARNGEIVTLLFFLLVLMVRRHDPTIDSTEKPMDMMILAGLTVARQIPPPDPWLAGFPINYHYGGYLLHALPAQLTGIKPEYAYNLAIPSAAALAAAIAFVTGRALFGRCRMGIITPVGIFLTGNLAGLTVMFSYMAFPHTLFEWRNGFLWKTSRVIFDNGGETINEYPFFTMVWGDLHPHFSDMPFLLLFLALCLALLLTLLAYPPRRTLPYAWPLIAGLMISGAFILPTNVFDFPIVMIFYAAVVFHALGYWITQRTGRWNDALHTGSLLTLPLISYALALPFWLYFQSPNEERLIRFTEFHTEFIEFLQVFGPHAAASLAVVFAGIYGYWQSGAREETAFVLALAGLAFAVAWAWFGYFVSALTPVLALAFWILAAMVIYPRHGQAAGTPEILDLFALLACALAWSMIAGCEFIYLKDNYGVARMNTLFKIHFPAWFLLGTGLPYLVYRAWKQALPFVPRLFAFTPVFLLFSLSLLPPAFFLGSLFRLQEPQRIVTLNGLASLERDRPFHYEMIEWIRAFTRPSDVILEVPGCSYWFESTISAFTGRPSVVGWAGHELLWRPSKLDGEVTQRKQDADRFYTTADWPEAQAILKKYNVRYVVFIPPECRETQPLAVQMRQGVFRQHLPPVTGQNGRPAFLQGQYELYKVPDGL
ncbi:MAG: DUF2298 domain-containing protein [bacterium]